MTSEELKRRRVALHLSQKHLAEVLGVSTSTVAHWEQGVQAIPAYLDLALQTLERNPTPPVPAAAPPLPDDPPPARRGRTDSL